MGKFLFVCCLILIALFLLFGQQTGGDNWRAMEIKQKIASY